ncbi:hypothetical protein [Fibrella forsythiae]|uniref:Cell division protein ZapA n=1 Tax=Fibrella forsythiae TaxID=2817061 RepID=A0ABS3JTF7_9BACT|nr:hypothetical protein [Fibrella forsythiae]MBO0953291.1 hypothetical protein [Fibrella forsythiae]
MKTPLKASPLASYTLPSGMNATNLTVDVVTRAASLTECGLQATPLPLPDEATKEHVLDAIALLETHLSNPALNALCSVALSWYLDMLTSQQIVNLSERMQLLIQRVAISHPSLID